VIKTIERERHKLSEESKMKKVIVAAILLHTCIVVVPSVEAFSLKPQRRSLCQIHSMNRQCIVVLQQADIDFDTKTSKVNLGNKFDAKTSRYGWQKAAPKESLKHVGQNDTASQWMLNTIEAAHYLIFPAQFTVFLAMLQYSNVWTTLFDDDILRLGLWIAAPMVRAYSQLFRIVHG
jgi:hypothetical protein